MSGKKKKTGVVIWLCLVILLLVAVVLTMPQQGEEESIKEVMRDAVLHENDKIDLCGLGFRSNGRFASGCSAFKDICDTTVSICRRKTPTRLRAGSGAVPVAGRV